MNSKFLFALAFIVVCARGELGSAVDFQTEVEPLLRKHCVGCHGGVKKAGDLSLINRNDALYVVEPGDADLSVMIDRVTSEYEDELMPPPEHGRSLTKSEVQLLRDWINEGASWVGTWSFEPIDSQSSDVPIAENDVNKVDSLVAVQRAAAKLDPAQPAKWHRWLRRVYLDTVGIPPTAREFENFRTSYEADPLQAKTLLVDELLADPRFGEHWASVWLDQMRYADSRGLGLDAPRQIWKYRDWVVDALNSDMPFDEFTIKQIAGDLLEEPSIDDLVATAASRLTQTNQEGGTDDEEFRVAAVLDRTSTIWQAWQGITFGCVQCHSHPYEPIEHDEFYSFAALLNNTADCDLNDDWPHVQAPLDRRDYERASKLDLEIAGLKDCLLEKRLASVNESTTSIVDGNLATVQANKSTTIRKETIEGVDQFVADSTLSADTTITLEVISPKPLDSLTAFAVNILPLDPEDARANPEWGFVLSHVTASLVNPEGERTKIKLVDVIGDEPDPIYDPRDSLVGKNQNGFAAFSRIHHPRRAIFVLEEPLSLNANQMIEVKLRQQARALGSFSLVSRRGFIELLDAPKLLSSLSAEDLSAMKSELTTLKKQRKSIKSVPIPVMKERPDKLARENRTFIRGLFLTKGEIVEPGIPKILNLDDRQVSNRMDLANWLVSDSNPLTARVLANRVWARVFGEGIVPTEEDFGVSGQRPSNPELLDELAGQLKDQDDWHIKPLIRRLLLSATYGQTAENPQSLVEDPANEFLARGPRFRMRAEAVRDVALHAAGLLSDQVGGAPVKPAIPDGVWKPFFGGDKWAKLKPGDEDRYRRSLYTYTKRSIPYPMFASFDAPSREICNPRRLRSNTPLQALTTLNDETFVECAERLAARMTDHHDNLKEQIKFAFVTVLTREPSKNEIETLIDLHETLTEDNVEANKVLQSLAAVVLNLDETVTK
ncbi:MAG: PSD1 and planctomycete cytochrome C domain-containing protein [Planctomycetota bacterium]